MACILILECRNTCNCFWRNRCTRQIIYLEHCCCFGWVWGRQYGGWTSVAGRGASRHVYVAGFTFCGNNSDKQFGPQTIWFFCAVQERELSESRVTHLSMNKESQRKKYTVHSRCLLSVLRKIKGRIVMLMLMTTKGEAAKKPTVSSDFESLKSCVVCSSRFETRIKTRLNHIVPFPNLYIRLFMTDCKICQILLKSAATRWWWMAPFKKPFISPGNAQQR